jgi:hypothetical protein
MLPRPGGSPQRVKGLISTYIIGKVEMNAR